MAVVCCKEANGEGVVGREPGTMETDPNFSLWKQLSSVIG